MAGNKTDLMAVFLVVAAVRLCSRANPAVPGGFAVTRWERSELWRRWLYGRRPLLTHRVTSVLAGRAGGYGEGGGCVDTTASSTRTSADLPRYRAALAGRRVEFLGGGRESGGHSRSDDRGAGGAR